MKSPNELQIVGNHRSAGSSKSHCNGAQSRPLFDRFGWPSCSCETRVQSSPANLVSGPCLRLVAAPWACSGGVLQREDRAVAGSLDSYMLQAASGLLLRTACLAVARAPGGSVAVPARAMTVHPSIHAASEEEKQKVRKKMQAALKLLATEQMAQESEWSAPVTLAACPSPPAKKMGCMHLVALCHPPFAACCSDYAVAGAAIGQRVVELEAFQQARRLAIYVHCARLREVDTTVILEAGMALPGAR